MPHHSKRTVGRSKDAQQGTSCPETGRPEGKASARSLTLTPFCTPRDPGPWLVACGLHECKILPGAFQQRFESVRSWSGYRPPCLSRLSKKSFSSAHHSRPTVPIVAGEQRAKRSDTAGTPRPARGLRTAPQKDLGDHQVPGGLAAPRSPRRGLEPSR